MKFFVFILILLLMHGFASSQSVSDILTETNDNFSKEENPETEDEIPIELQRIIDHPININSDEIEILAQLNLISQTQLNALKKHIATFGKLIALEELQVIDEFDIATIRSILPYIEITGRTAADNESQSLTFRFQQQVKDYVPADFQGDPSKITLKYRGNFNGNISCAVLAEKDPGEKVIFGSGKAGFDFYSFFVQFKLNHKISRIIVGDYTVSFGQGLTAWSGSGFSSNENIISICKSGRGIYPSTSTDENRYLRGIAIEGKWKNLKWYSWFSSHKIDGNVEVDTIDGTEYLRSLLTSGYHRTQNESSGYHVCRETYFGTNLNFEMKGWKLGLTGAGQMFSIPIKKTLQNYNQFDFRGASNINFGFDYNKNFKNILIFGEAGISSNMAIAFLNGILISAGKNISISAAHHSYQKEFHSLKSNAIGSNTNPANENGIYFGTTIKLNKALALTTYVDRNEYPYLKYRADLPSSSVTKGGLLTYSPGKKLSIALRYRNKTTQVNRSQEYSGLRSLNENNIRNIRFSVSLVVNETWDYRSKIETGLKRTNSLSVSKGYIYCQDLFFHPPKKKINLNARYAVFYSPDFDLRFYEYENDLPGAFSIPFYYGNGSKFYINLNYKIRNMTISTKFARTWIIYDDDLLGTTQIVDEIKLQVRLNL